MHEIENVDEFDWSRDGQAIVYCEWGSWPFAENKEFHFNLAEIDDLAHPRVLMVVPWRAEELHWSPTEDRILAPGHREVGEDLATHLYLFDLSGWVQEILLPEISPAPAIATVYLTGRKRDSGSQPRAVHAAGGCIWSPNHAEVDSASVVEARALGLSVIPWTDNEPAAIERVLDLGVDGLISDFPDRARAQMQRRGLPLPPQAP